MSFADDNTTCSRSVSLEKKDSRCHAWAIVIRAEDALPLPGEVTGANDLDKPYLARRGSIEISPGDFLLMGEANHPTKMRGWSYLLFMVDREKEYLRSIYCGAEAKALIREKIDALPTQERDAHLPLLMGSGGVAAMVRAIHAKRRGLI